VRPHSYPSNSFWVVVLLESSDKLQKTSVYYPSHISNICLCTSLISNIWNSEDKNHLNLYLIWGFLLVKDTKNTYYLRLTNHVTLVFYMCTPVLLTPPIVWTEAVSGNQEILLFIQLESDAGGLFFHMPEPSPFITSLQVSTVVIKPLFRIFDLVLRTTVHRRCFASTEYRLSHFVRSALSYPLYKGSRCRTTAAESHSKTNENQKWQVKPTKEPSAYLKDLYLGKKKQYSKGAI